MPPPDPAIKRAIDAVAPLPDDHRIRPGKHADLLKATAPELAELLSDGEMITTAEESERQAALSKVYQGRFRQRWMAAAIAGLVFTIASGAILAVNAAFAEGSAYRKPMAVSFSVLSLMAAAVGVWLIANIRGTGLFSLWNKARAKAEEGKAQLATRLASLTPPAGKDVAFVQLCQFEYLRRIVLDSQLRFYEAGAGKQRDSADRLTALESTAAAATALSAAAVGAGLFTGGAWAAWLPMFGVMAGALTAFAASFDQLYQHRHLASLYEDTRQALVRVKAQVDATREAIASGVAEALPAFVKAVLEPMQAEHRQWLERGAAADEVLERLQNVLHSKKDPAKQ